VLVSGEPGVGKASVARAVLGRRFPGSDVIVVNCSDADAARAFVADAHMEAPVILAHVELLDAELAYRLRDRVRRSQKSHRYLVGTTNTTNAERPLDLPLVDELGRVRLDVPCLRYRRDDIAPLVEHFARQMGSGPRQFSPEAMQLMLRYPWPGNVRELRSVVEGVVGSTHGNVELEDLPGDLRRLATRRPLSPLEQAEADAILAALRACGNNKVQAASLLQISRSRLYRKASAYGLVGTVLG
jgi:DNA-binding NtrC family response regulator